MFWTNKNIPIAVNSEIIEYDIKSGNTSIMEAFQLAPPEKIKKLRDMKKEDRTRAVGLMMRDDPKFAKDLEAGFNQVVKEFLTTNELNLEENVISIKRDAVFVLNAKVRCTTIQDCCKFVPKGNYTEYLYVSPFEFYLDHDSIDVKGLSDDLIPLHQDGILYLIRTICETCATCHMDSTVINKLMHEITEAYKNRELDFACYREFNASSKFKVLYLGRELLMENMAENFIAKCDISYNYQHLIIPIIRALC